MTTGNKTSSISTSASAPGKLILFGEHAVVHGEPAIAACLTDLRIKVDVCTRKDGVISINLPDLKPEPLSIEIPSLSLLKIDQLEISASSSPSSSVSEGKEKCFKSLLGEKGPPTSDNTKAIHEILAKVASYKSKSENKNKKNSNNSNQNETEESVSPLSELHISALTPLIYLINILLSSLSFNDGLSIIVKSQNLPLGAGLGSSAAFSVAASAALYKLFLLLEDDNGDNDGNDDDDDGDEKKCSTDGISIGAGAGTDNNNQRPAKKMKTEFQDTRNKLEQVGQPTKEQLDTINMLAFYSETLIHGTPSGIDNTVSTYGGALQYTKTKHAIKEGKKETRAESETIFLHNFPQLNVILTNTNVPRSTRILVQGVKTLKEDYPEIVDPILDSIGQIARTFRKNVLQQNSNIDSSKSLSIKQSKQISKLIQMNHSLLCTLGVSHPSLNAITNLTESLYEELQCSTKLTGAGGGGCAFTFLEDDVGNSAPVNDNDEIDNRCGLTNIEERLKVISDKIEALKCDKMKNDDKKDNDAVEIQKNPWSFQCFTSAVGGKGVLWL